ncbi:MAG: radical SAM protein [Acidilobus sp.]
MQRYAFGPLVSRRLGVSLGVNNVPYKACTYSCVYCQLGRTLNLSITRREFYPWNEIVSDVVRAANEFRGRLDFITFVPDGEPLLDKNLGREVEGIKGELSVPVAVITNGSLLFMEDPRADLSGADLVSVKVDAVSEVTWRRVDRPHPALRLERVLEGVREFASGYRGRLLTETMLVEGLNTGSGELEGIASFIEALRPYRAYIAVPVRPPAEGFVRPPSPVSLVKAYEVFRGRLGEGRVELLNLPSPPPPPAHGDPASWLLLTVSVHPLMVDHAVRSLSAVTDGPERLISELESRNLIKVVDYLGQRFLVASFSPTARGQAEGRGAG